MFAIQISTVFFFFLSKIPYLFFSQLDTEMEDVDLKGIPFKRFDLRGMHFKGLHQDVDMKDIQFKNLHRKLPSNSGPVADISNGGN